MTSSAKGFPDCFAEGAETCTRGRVRSPIHELGTRTLRSGRADCGRGLSVLLRDLDLAQSDKLRREFFRNAGGAGIEERVAAGEGARTGNRVGETSSASAMDLRRSLGFVC